MRKSLNTQKSTSLFQISKFIIYEELIVLFDSIRDINIKHKIALHCNRHWNEPPVVGNLQDGCKLATSFTFKSFRYHPFLTTGWTEWTLPPFKQMQHDTCFETSLLWSAYQETSAVSGHLLLLGCSERRHLLWLGAHITSWQSSVLPTSNSMNLDPALPWVEAVGEMEVLTPIHDNLRNPKMRS